jgi:DNA-binding GntR family transcriptional regulator
MTLTQGLGEYHLELLAKTQEKKARVKTLIDLNSTLTQVQIAKELGVSVKIVREVMQELRGNK